MSYKRQSNVYVISVTTGITTEILQLFQWNYLNTTSRSANEATTMLKIFPLIFACDVATMEYTSEDP